MMHRHRSGETQRERPLEMGITDEKTGRKYWIDPKTGKATWESKHWWTEVPVEKGEHKGHTYWYNHNTKEKVWERPKSESWVTWHDEVL